MAQPSDTADSLYSSFNRTSSSSSFSISCSCSSDTIDPSTSGCSSDMMKNSRSKARKKEKVKEYLKELKSMVSKSKPGKAGTLTTLQHVINSMRKIKADQQWQDTEPVKTVTCKTSSASEYSREDLESGFHSLNTQQIDDELVIPSTQDSIIIVLSTWLGIIENISENAKIILGYPKDLILGRPLSDFISKRDQAAFNSILSVDVTDIEKAEKVTGVSEEVNVEEAQKKITYFRIRQYKSLDRGFRLNAMDSFIPYQAVIRLKNLKGNERVIGEADKVMPMESEAAPHGSIWSSIVRRGKQPYLALECMPLKTAYTSPQCVPENVKFCTRHTLYCSYSYIHSNAIPLLGYLPQDIIGSSVFDYYHPDDLTELYAVYQQVLSSEGKTFRGKPYRQRVRNGDYILLETEWSSFINPWSRKLEFIIGQHTVLRGPDNPDVFANAAFPKKPVMESVYTHSLTIQQKIQNLLLKPIKLGPKSSLKSPTEEDQDKQEKTVTFDVGTPDVDNLEDLQDRAGPHSPAVSLPPSPSHPGYDSEAVLTYEQLNYKQNISRFLLSQPKTFSSEDSDKKSSSSPGEEEPGEEELSDELLEAFQVHFPIPKPPSFGSSTKVLVSEQEPREEIREDVPIASPSREEPMEDTVSLVVPHETEVTPVWTEVPEIQHAYLPVALTQEMLRAHTKRQEKLYVQQAAQDNSYLSASLSPTLFKTPHRHKRLLSPERDLCEERMFKAPKALRTSTSEKRSMGLLNPPFPMIPVDNQPPQSSVTEGKGGEYQSVSSAQLMGLNLQGMYSQTIPVMQLDHNTLSSMGMGVNACSSTDVQSQQMLSNMQWPYCTPTALPYLPLYTPVSLFNTYSTPGNTHCTYSRMSSQQQNLMASGRKTQTQSSCPSTISTVPKYERKKQLSRKQHTAQAGKQKGKSSSESSDNNSSLGETSSSLLYLLESGSHSFSSGNQEEMESSPKVQCRLPELPPWLLGAKWTEEVEKRYSMPKRNIAQVLKEDREKLAGFKQSETSWEQLSEMLAHLSNPSAVPTMDEEADQLFFMEDYEMELGEILDNDLASIGSRHSIGSCGNNHDHGISSFELPASLKSNKNGKKHTKNEEHEEKKAQEKHEEEPSNVEMQKEEDYKNEQEDASAGSPGKFSDSAELESNSSKESSNLTPSDQRSSEEAPSSLKESDTASKEESDSSSREQKESSGSENDFQALDAPDFFDQIFVSLKVEFPQLFGPCKLNKVSSWILESKFSKDVEMMYQLQMRPLAEILQRDKKMLEEMTQPTDVKLQFNQLRAQIMEDLNVSFKHLHDSEGGKRTSHTKVGVSLDTTATHLPLQDTLMESTKSTGVITDTIEDVDSKTGSESDTVALCIKTGDEQVDKASDSMDAETSVGGLSAESKQIVVKMVGMEESREMVMEECSNDMWKEMAFSKLFLPFPWEEQQSC